MDQQRRLRNREREEELNLAKKELANKDEELNLSKMEEDLIKRTQESYEKKDYTGRFTSYIKEEYQSNFWKCQEGDHLIDIIPFRAGSLFPTVPQPNVRPGDWTYYFEVWDHTNIGQNEASFVCLNRMFNKPCPICEDLKEKRKTGEYEDEELKLLNPKRKVMYNIIVYDTEKEEKKGVQQWIVAHWFMEKHLVVLAKSPRKGGIIPFPSITQGKSIAFTRRGSGASNTEFLGHKFEDRDYKLDPKVLEMAKPLDELIIVHSYDEIAAAHFGTTRSKIQVETEEDIGIENDIKEQTETSIRKLQRQVKEVKEKVSEVKNRCPGGGVFGVDIEKLPHCSECKIWDDCVIEEERLEREKEKRY